MYPRGDLVWLSVELGQKLSFIAHCLLKESPDKIDLLVGGLTRKKWGLECNLLQAILPHNYNLLDKYRSREDYIDGYAPQPKEDSSYGSLKSCTAGSITFKDLEKISDQVRLCGIHASWQFQNLFDCPEAISRTSSGVAGSVLSHMVYESDPEKVNAFVLQLVEHARNTWYCPDSLASEIAQMSASILSIIHKALGK